MATITTNFPTYTGGDIRRTANQAEFDTAINYFFDYHVNQFKPVIDNFTGQANAVRNEINGFQSAILEYKNDAYNYSASAQGYMSATLRYRDEAVDAKEQAIGAKNIIDSYGITSETASTLTEIRTLTDSFDGRLTDVERNVMRVKMQKFGIGL